MSGIIPRQVYADWDGFGVLVREAGRRGLGVYPVQCAMSCGGEQRMAGVRLQHPEWTLRDAAGEPLEFISSVHSEARKRVASVSREVADRYVDENGGSGGARTRNLCRDRAAL